MFIIIIFLGFIPAVHRTYFIASCSFYENFSYLNLSFYYMIHKTLYLKFQRPGEGLIFLYLKNP